MTDNRNPDGVFSDLVESHPIRLLTTRVRIVAAIGLTGFAFAQSIRGLYPGHRQSSWLLSPSVLFHGWPLIAFNVFIYCYLCWVSFWLIRGTTGRERVFMVGWFAPFALWPLRMAPLAGVGFPNQAYRHLWVSSGTIRCFGALAGTTEWG